MIDLDTLAAHVDAAAREGVAIAQLSNEHELTLEQAYEIQKRSIARRFARGEKLVGYKMGLTSRAKMNQVGVHEVIWGRLTDAMRVEDGGTLDIKGKVHPRVEPEIAFILGERLSGDVSPAEAMAAVAGVAPALEIIDSRYENFRFALPDVVADNSSSSSFVVGAFVPPALDLSNVGLVMELDGRPVQFGSSAAILGHPARSLAAASRLLAREGLALEPGMIVMAGGATAAEPLRRGVSVRLAVELLGRVSFRVAD